MFPPAFFFQTYLQLVLFILVCKKDWAFVLYLYTTIFFTKDSLSFLLTKSTQIKITQSIL